MVARAIKREILMRLIKPIFDDIGSGFSSRRPKGVENIKGGEERTKFKQEYISQNDDALEEYINSRAEQLQGGKSKSSSTKDIKVSLELPKDDTTGDVLSEIRDVLHDIKENTKPMSFKDKVLAKKEDEQDDKALQELIKTLKDKEDKDVNISGGDNGSLLGDLIGGALGGGAGVDIGIDPDLDMDRKNPKSGKRSIFKRAKDFVTNGKTNITSKVGDIASKGKGLAVTGARALGGLAMANPVAATVIGVGALAYGGYKLWDNMRGEEDSKKVFDQLVKEGIIDHDIIGNSEILKWDMIKKLKPEDLELLIAYDDFSPEDTAKLKAILKNKQEKKKVQKTYDIEKKEKTRQKDSLRQDVQSVYGKDVDVDAKIKQHIAELKADKTIDFDSLSIEEKTELITKKAYLEAGRKYKGLTDTPKLKEVKLEQFAKPKEVSTTTDKVAKQIGTPDNRYGNITDVRALENHKKHLNEILSTTKSKPRTVRLMRKIGDINKRIEELQKTKEDNIPSKVMYNGVEIHLTEKQKREAPTDDLEYIDWLEAIAKEQQSKKVKKIGNNPMPTIESENPNIFTSKAPKDFIKVNMSDMSKRGSTYNSKGYSNNIALGGAGSERVEYDIKTINPTIGSAKVDDYSIKDLFDKGANVKEENIKDLDPNMLHNLKAMAAEYYDTYGEKLKLNSAFRDPKYQDYLFKKAVKKYGSVEKARKWVAPAGNSMHNYGLAVDIPSEQLNKAHSSGLMAKYGFHRPVKHEGWHLEPSGINRTAVKEVGKKNLLKGSPLLATSPVKDVSKGVDSELDSSEQKSEAITKPILLASNDISKGGSYKISSNDKITKIPETTDTKNVSPNLTKDSSGGVGTISSVNNKKSEAITKPILLASNDSSKNSTFSKIDDTTLILLSNEE